MVTAAVEGAAVYEFLGDATKKVRAETDLLRDDIRRLDVELDDVVAHRGDALLALAQHYLPTMSREQIEDTFAGVRDELLALHERKQRRQRDVASQFEQIDRTSQQLNERLGVSTRQLNEKVEERDRLEKQVAEDLAASDEFQRLSKLALQAEQRLTQNEGRVEEFRREAAEKLPSYENNRFFQYLYSRNYGTPQYAHRGLTRRLDRWIAGLIDYSRARRSYEFLRVTPRLMAEEVVRRREEFAQHMLRLEEIEDQISDRVGLTLTLADGERLGTERDELVGTLSREQERAVQLKEELIRLEQSQGEFYEEAIDRFKRFLDNTETSVLERQADKTPQAEDDRIVAEISELNRSLDSIKSRLADLTQTHEEAEDRLRGMQYVVGRFQQMDYDSQRSFFEPGFDPEEPMHQFFRGEITRRAFWRAYSRGQRFRPTWLESTAATSADFMESEGGRILMHALLQVAGPTMRDVVDRGMRRRGGMGQQRRESQGRPRSGGGFTNGRGF